MKDITGTFQTKSAWRMKADRNGVYKQYF